MDGRKKIAKYPLIISRSTQRASFHQTTNNLHKMCSEAISHTTSDEKERESKIHIHFPSEKVLLLFLRYSEKKMGSLYANWWHGNEKRDVRVIRIRGAFWRNSYTFHTCIRRCRSKKKFSLSSPLRSKNKKEWVKVLIKMDQISRERAKWN